MNKAELLRDEIVQTIRLLNLFPPSIVKKMERTSLYVDEKMTDEEIWWKYVEEV